MTSQGTITVHAAEHLASSDRGVVRLRRQTDTPLGMATASLRATEGRLWIRTADVIAPNVAQFPRAFETGEDRRSVLAAFATRWIVPIDDTSSWVIGFRHFIVWREDPICSGLERLCREGGIDGRLRIVDFNPTLEGLCEHLFHTVKARLPLRGARLARAELDATATLRATYHEP